MIFEDVKSCLFRSKEIFVHPMSIKSVLKISQQGEKKTSALTKQTLLYYINYVLVVCFH